MAWGELKKEDLVKAGLDPDVVTGMKTTLDGVEEKIKNAVTEANKVNTETLAGLKQSLEALQTKLSVAQEKPNNPNNPNPPNNEEPAPDWMIEPEKAAARLVADQDRKIGGVAQIAANMRADMNYNNFKASGPKGFAKYEKDIKEMYDKQSLVNRCDPKLVENIYKIILADHIDEVARMGETFFVESVGNNKPGDPAPPKKKPEDILSKDELEQATKWGVTPEDYLKEKSAISGVTYA